jgi:hypothetical protein
MNKLFKTKTYPYKILTQLLLRIIWSVTTPALAQRPHRYSLIRDVSLVWKLKLLLYSNSFAEPHHFDAL